MTLYKQGFRDGERTMKSRAIEALKQAHARDVANDQCERDVACAQCDDWYRAIETVEKLEVSD